MEILQNGKRTQSIILRDSVYYVQCTDAVLFQCLNYVNRFISYASSISSHHTPLLIHKSQFLPWSVFSHEKSFLIQEFSLFLFLLQDGIAALFSIFTFSPFICFSHSLVMRQEIQTRIWTWNAATGEAEIRSKSEPFINQTSKVLCCNLCLTLLCTVITERGKASNTQVVKRLRVPAFKLSPQREPRPLKFLSS